MFKPRMTRPESGNPYYNTPAKGGYAVGAILGKPTDSGCDVLANCVGYATGQFICYFYDANENFLPSQTDTSWVNSSTLKAIPNAKKLRVLMRMSSDTGITIGNISTFKILFK